MVGATDKSLRSKKPWSAATFGACEEGLVYSRQQRSGNISCTHGGSALFNLDKELATQRDTSRAASKVVVSRNKAVPRGIPLVTALQGFLSIVPMVGTFAKKTSNGWNFLKRQKGTRFLL
ncbi:MAG: hypothetical protein EOL87_16920 [Spartobacteria bacterium]|nr:hypothetical protein [Spartobacteria bacterium]